MNFETTQIYYNNIRDLAFRYEENEIEIRNIMDSIEIKNLCLDLVPQTTSGQMFSKIFKNYIDRVDISTGFSTWNKSITYDILNNIRFKIYLTDSTKYTVSKQFVDLYFDWVNKKR